MADVINGTDLRLYADGKVIGAATSCTLNLAKESSQTVHKDNVGGYATYSQGTKSATISFEGFTSDLDTRNTVAVHTARSLFDLYNADTVFAWKFTTDEVGGTEYSGSAFVGDLAIAAPVEENSTVSGTFTVNGAVAAADVAP